jgi:hypothetical protein
MTEKGKEYKTDFVAVVRMGKLLPATQENKGKERYTEGVHSRGIIVDKEYQSVCPLVGIGSPTPSPTSECVSPLGTKGGSITLPRGVREWGDPIRTIGKKAWHSVYSLVYILVKQADSGARIL